MKLSLVVAMAENNVIGKDNRLPWHLPAELKQFKALTMGHPIIMGRKTYDSIGRPLPGRRNIVITRNAEYLKDGVEVVHSINEALNLCKASEEAFVIGGANIYRETITLANRIYLTKVNAVVEGDAFFPAINLAEWQETKRSSRAADTDNIYAYDVIVYDRKTSN